MANVSITIKDENASDAARRGLFSFMRESTAREIP